MNSRIDLHLIRHVPVINPDKIWYGEKIDTDTSSSSVTRRFNELAALIDYTEKGKRFYTSPFKRAVETAELTMAVTEEECSSPLKFEADFRKQNLGTMTGRIHDEIKDQPAVAAYLNDMWNTPPENGESLKMFQWRVVHGLEKAVYASPVSIRNIFIFCHSGVQMAALANAQGRRMDAVIAERAADKDNSLNLNYMSVLSLSYSRGERKWNPEFRIDSGINKLTP